MIVSVKSRLAAATLVLGVVCAGCATKRAEYEFLAMPRAGLRPGTVWKEGLGPVSGRPGKKVRVTRMARGLDWLQKQTAGEGGAALKAVLADFFAVTLGVERKYITSVQAIGLAHRRVANPGALSKGRSYLWETVEAERVRVRVGRDLAGSMAARISRFARSETGRRSGIEFWPVAGSDRELYEVAGRNLVVAVKVVKFRARNESRAVTVRLGRAWQDKEQAGAFGYRMMVGSGDVEVLKRRFRTVLWNPKLADAGGRSLNRTLSGKSAQLYSGAIIGGRSDAVTDSARVSSWNYDGLSCRVTFDRTHWSLSRTESGLQTVK